VVYIALQIVMPSSEVLTKYLASKRPSAEDYYVKLDQYHVFPDKKIIDLKREEGFRDFIRKQNVTFKQRAGISMILGSVERVHLRDPGGGVLETYELTVGDIRELSDQDLRKLTGDRGVKVLRKLFGGGNDAEEKPSVPPFLQGRVSSKKQALLKD